MFQMTYIQIVLVPRATYSVKFSKIFKNLLLKSHKRDEANNLHT